jgi:hypothetical protein
MTQVPWSEVNSAVRAPPEPVAMSEMAYISPSRLRCVMGPPWAGIVYFWTLA